MEDYMKFTLALAALAFAFNAQATDPKQDQATVAKTQDPKIAEMMTQMKEYGTPGEQHKMLMKYAGQWNYTMKSWMSPDAKPEETKGKSTLKPVLGGRWLQQEIKGTAMGMPFEGIGFVGYNNFTKQYETSFYDSMGTGSMHGTGSWASDKKAITETGEYACPMTKNMHEKYRAEWVFNDADHMTYTMWGPGLHGEKDMKSMEITYTRAGKQNLASK